MLSQLIVRNYAIIQQVNLEFHPALNIITGETGAGKSILVGALGLVLGDRADNSVLLSKTEKCVVEASFSGVAVQAANKLLKEFDIDESLELSLRREINPAGKSRAFINDTPVTLQQLRQVALLVVDLHRQFDALQLGSESFAHTVLNAVAGTNLLFQNYQRLFHQYRATQAELQQATELQQQAARELDYHQFLHDELAEVAFQPNEIESLEEELLTLSHAEEIQSQLNYTDNALHGDGGMLGNLRIMQQRLQNLRGAPAPILVLTQRLQSLYVELKDIGAELQSLSSEIDHSGERQQWVEERMGIAQRLLKKHQLKQTAELLALQNELAGKLKQHTQLDAEIAQLTRHVDQQLKAVTEVGQELQQKQAAIFEQFSERVHTLLAKMEMPNAKVKIEATALPEPGIHGLNRLSILFDANKTGRFETIDKVASGGELSRLMLSIKSLVASSTELPVLIFDEIDSGISGEAARQVGAIMKELAAHHQIIAITHQPQIAALASQHLFIYKEEKEGKVKTQVRALDKSERIKAIARMLGGNELSEASLRIAGEMVKA